MSQYLVALTEVINGLQRIVEESKALFKTKEDRENFRNLFPVCENILTIVTALTYNHQFNITPYEARLSDIRAKLSKIFGDVEENIVGSGTLDGVSRFLFMSSGGTEHSIVTQIKALYLRMPRNRQIAQLVVEIPPEEKAQYNQALPTAAPVATTTVPAAAQAPTSALVVPNETTLEEMFRRNNEDLERRLKAQSDQQIGDLSSRLEQQSEEMRKQSEDIRKLQNKVEIARKEGAEEATQRIQTLLLQHFPEMEDKFKRVLMLEGPPSSTQPQQPAAANGSSKDEDVIDTEKDAARAKKQKQLKNLLGTPHAKLIEGAINYYEAKSASPMGKTIANLIIFCCLYYRQDKTVRQIIDFAKLNAITIGKVSEQQFNRITLTEMAPFLPDLNKLLDAKPEPRQEGTTKWSDKDISSAIYFLYKPDDKLGRIYLPDELPPPTKDIPSPIIGYGTSFFLHLTNFQREVKGVARPPSFPDYVQSYCNKMNALSNSASMNGFYATSGSGVASTTVPMPKQPATTKGVSLPTPNGSYDV